MIKDAFAGFDFYIQSRKCGRIRARLFDLEDYPGAKPTTIRSKEVFGEIYEIKPEYFDSVLKELDVYEEFSTDEKKSSLFTRKITPVITEGKVLLDAWVYWYNRRVSGKREIASGDYKKYLHRNKLNTHAHK